MNATLNKLLTSEVRYVKFSGFSWLAAFWSYAVNKSILWAIFHSFCGPAYIAYRLVFHTTFFPK